MTNDEIESAILRLCRERGAGLSICPSEVARSLAADESAWRALMPRIREVARELQSAGMIDVTQKSRIVDPAAARGPIRLTWRGSRDK